MLQVMHPSHGIIKSARKIRKGRCWKGASEECFFKQNGPLVYKMDKKWLVSVHDAAGQRAHRRYCNKHQEISLSLRYKTRVPKASLQVKALLFPHVSPFPWGIPLGLLSHWGGQIPGRTLPSPCLSQAWTPAAPFAVGSEHRGASLEFSQCWS